MKITIKCKIRGGGGIISVYYPLSIGQGSFKASFNFNTETPQYLQKWQIEEIATHLFKQRKINNVKLYLTHKCNYSCPMCPYHGKGFNGSFLNKNPKDELSLENAINIIDKLANYGLDKICLTAPGEAILNTNILKIIEYCKQKGFYTVLATNGALCDEKKVQELKKAGLDEVDISIDSIEKESYKQIRSKNETYFNNAINAPILFKKAGFFVSTSYVEQEPNKDGFNGLFSLYSNSKINNIRWQHVRSWDKDAKQINARYDYKYEGEYLHGLCQFYSVIIDTDGALFGCCHMEFLKDLGKLPNMLETSSFQEALSKLDNLLMSEKMYKVCEECDTYAPSVESAKCFNLRGDYMEVQFPAGNKVYTRIPAGLQGASASVLKYLYQNNLVTKMKLEGVL